MNLVSGLAINPKWIEHPAGVWEVIGSIPVGDSFFSLPHACDMLIIFIFTKLKFF